MKSNTSSTGKNSIGCSITAVVTILHCRNSWLGCHFTGDNILALFYQTTWDLVCLFSLFLLFNTEKLESRESPVFAWRTKKKTRDSQRQNWRFLFHRMHWHTRDTCGTCVPFTSLLLFAFQSRRIFLAYCFLCLPSGFTCIKREEKIYTE